MSEHRASLSWQRTSPDFSYDHFDRTHTITFCGGISVKASATAAFAGDASCVNPEELLTAAVSSCYMLTFLAVAAKRNLIVDVYDDNAVGILGKNDKGKTAIVRITLQPKIIFNGNSPAPEELRLIHEKAHANCFISNSVCAEVVVQY